MDHCMNLESLFRTMLDKFNIEYPADLPFNCSIVHDVCKLGAYIIKDGQIQWNTNNPKGHASLSLHRIKNYIDLTPQETEIIKYHMGMYATHEFSDWTGEFPLKELSDAFNKNKLAKLFYFCDDMVSQFLDVQK